MRIFWQFRHDLMTEQQMAEDRTVRGALACLYVSIHTACSPLQDELGSNQASLFQFNHLAPHPEESNQKFGSADDGNQCQGVCQTLGQKVIHHHHQSINQSIERKKYVKKGENQV